MKGAHHELLDEVLAADADLLQLFGLSLVSATAEGVTLAATPVDAMVNALGVAHGSFLFTLADTAAAYAMAARGFLGPTINANVSFTGPIRAGATATALAQITTASRSLATVTSTVTSVGDVVGHGVFQFYITTGGSR
jgi:acyl-CoA thioesterase